MSSKRGFIVVEDAYRSERGVFDKPVLFADDDVEQYKARKLKLGSNKVVEGVQPATEAER